MPSIPVYVLAGTPGALPVGHPADIPTVEWTSICHDRKRQRFLLIDYDRVRYTSRWQVATNKRPFVVRDAWHNRVTASSTLAGAIKAARKAAESRQP